MPAPGTAPARALLALLPVALQLHGCGSSSNAAHAQDPGADISHITAAASPQLQVLWVSSPVLPGETALVTHSSPGSGYRQGSWPATKATLCRSSTICVSPTVLQQDNSSTMLTVPRDWPTVVYRLTLCPTCAAVLINAPDPWWAQGDRGRLVSAGPGGWLRVFGRSLAFAGGNCVPASRPLPIDDSTAAVRLTRTDGSNTTVELAVTAATCYDLVATVPHGTPVGEYTVSVRSGLSAGWDDWMPIPESDGGGALTIAATPPPPITTATVVDAPSLRRALRAAAAGHSSTGEATVERFHCLSLRFH
jgi:hypothetical protein